MSAFHELVLPGLDGRELPLAPLKEQLTTDPHSPGSVRAATSPRNIDAWYAAFGVSSDQKAYIAPEARARIW
ncbi:MAG: hypothetical protein B7Z23_10110 [Pseudomonadales bacterium 32-61-5]|nr:MAG: hypothetical protein B7Z23_10110 [Pseudomonadales bacterium 32-61-5]